MKNRTNKHNELNFVGSSLQSGHVQVSLNGKKIGDVSIANGIVGVDVPNDFLVNFPVNKFPSKFKELSLAHKMSRIFSTLGLKIDMTEDGEELASLGKGVHSLLGNVKLKISRLRKFM